METIRRLWQRDSCVVLRCTRCGLGFAYPFVAGDAEYYSILHEQRHYPAWRWDYDVAVRDVLSRWREGWALDIGAGDGAFLARLEAGWRRFACEGSDRTRGELAAKGITVFDDLEEALPRYAGSFRVITLFQVLEHLTGHAALLGRCRELLEPDGVLVVSVPDGNAVSRQERITGCPDMPPNHVCRWTPESLELVLRNSGLVAAPPIFEPASWRHLIDSLHLILLAQAARGNPLASRVYAASSRRVRVPLLAILAVPALLSRIPVLTELRKGGAFALVARRAPS